MERRTSNGNQNLAELIRLEVLEIVPIITKQLAAVIPNIIREIIPAVTTIMLGNSKEDDTDYEKIYEDYRWTHGFKLSDNLESREKLYYVYKRYDEYLHIYEESSMQEPPYVPRKFCSDKRHVLSTAELRMI